MTDPQTPGQPENSGQQEQGTQQPPAENWQARYTGAVRKIEELTLSSREVQSQLAARASELEQLKAQLSLKETEKTVAVGERDKRLNTLLEETAAAQAQLKELNAFKAKVAMANELGRPELIKIIDRIPAVDDPAVLKGIMEDFLGFADGLVKDREKQLLSGVVPPIGPGGGQPGKPSSEAAWAKQIESLPQGSRERMQAMDDYYDFLANKNK